ncbi:5-carboxymethyl-2-hydroxymuconate Delta-isomerase [Bergeriella denitrificans]|uniref:5-carboxymethyl-2-hydroxymuconate isomerase n=1 Tax=Bergeriella denitrificans TaxID=494 RepID=A0A378UEJ8_BERDE|nr:5-carboxymethyl-2-hydroxymuconate Delta-isomerase [Bergeriella denitrificans]STZ75735.1 5-carboxymethyl-2-hydroxymuconate isomerase [Bergeriella denitrificans]
MPHLMIEYNRTLPLDTAALIRRCHAALTDSGCFSEADIKIRAAAYDDYLVGGKTQNFIHAALLLMEGRSGDVKKQLAEAVAESLRAALPAQTAYCEITVEIRDLAAESYTKVYCRNEAYV